MSRWEFKLPDIGEGVSEGEIVSWLVKPGDVVKEDQPMVEVMTDKATVTIGAPRAGTIAETRGKVGDVIAVHAVLVVFDVDADAGAAPGSSSAVHKAKGNGHLPTNGTELATQKKEDGPAATAVGDIREDLPGMGARRLLDAEGGRSPVPLGRDEGYFNDKPLATPATRKAARDLSVDLKRVPPTGPQGRVTKLDVETFSQGAPTLRPRTEVHQPGSGLAASALQSGVAPLKIAAPTGRHAGLEQRVPFAGLRRKIAVKMAQSKHTAAHFTFVEECDATALSDLRTRLKNAAEDQGVKLTYLPFIIKACVAALKRHPVLNSTLDESTNELVYRGYYNIGVATSTEAGLIVPVIKDCDKRSVLEIAREIERVSADAKAGKSRIEDLSGSTFTITSLGAQAGLFATPIINFPEVGILGVHRIKERPVVKDGQIVIGRVMLLSLSFDHRIVDGHVGAAFAYEIISYLEKPEKLFLEMV